MRSFEQILTPIAEAWERAEVCTFSDGQEISADAGLLFHSKTMAIPLEHVFSIAHACTRMTCLPTSLLHVDNDAHYYEHKLLPKHNQLQLSSNLQADAHQPRWKGSPTVSGGCTGTVG